MVRGSEFLAVHAVVSHAVGSQLEVGLEARVSKLGPYGGVQLSLEKGIYIFHIFLVL
jgi:hypothetical protein